ncbi:cytochrome c-type biogenesis protein CcmH [Microbacterium album]|uniref:Cytochrome c-type biogenesis protein n=1 Tax=Microbacterium album TaxID=2053191 RepID=A0A917MML8_9MICO|nr:cytochrome c-type biogenesis protein CcmH [Microbacterium album]GGH48013.1 hypothetical protein GCM10010921_25170 [Microbacterium album]
MSGVGAGARGGRRRSGGRDGWATRTALIAAAAIALACLAWVAVSPGTATPEAAARAVSETLRCPTCLGESVADSTSPVAVAMREEVERQVEAGRDADAVRGWFAERYGDEVLLAPPPRGAGWIAWAAPVAIGGIAVALLAAGARGGRRGRAVAIAVAAVLLCAAGAAAAGALREARPAAPDTAAATSPEVLREAVDRSPGDAGLRIALGMAQAHQGSLTEAAAELEAAWRLRPGDAQTGFLLADVLLRDGQLAAAGRTLDEVLAGDPHHGPALLLRGTMLWRDGDERAARLLERFVELHPEDPAASEARALLSAPRTAAGAGGAGQRSAPDRSELRVGLIEWAVEVDADSVRAGEVTVVVTNAGASAHRLVVEGVAGHWETPLLHPGESHELTIRTEEGETLTMGCSVRGHEAHGPRELVRVTR